MCSALGDIRFVPIADMSHSITSSARAIERRRYREAKRLGGLEVDDQFIPDRCLHWQVGRLLALEDAVDV